MYDLELKPFFRNWSPAGDWDKEIEKIFNNGLSQSSYVPACEVMDDEKVYTLSLDIPGLSQEDVEIEVKENQLFIFGERKLLKERTQVLRSERKYGKFSRVFTLPQDVNTEGIEARFESGVLEVILPKEVKAQPRKIAIKN